jgi:hypothetical protein
MIEDSQERDPRLTTNAILTNEIKSCKNYAKECMEIAHQKERKSYYAHTFKIFTTTLVGCLGAAMDPWPEAVDAFFIGIAVVLPLLAVLDAVQFHGKWGASGEKFSNAANIFIGLGNSANDQLSLDPHERLDFSTYMSNFTIAKSLALSSIDLTPSEVLLPYIEASELSEERDSIIRSSETEDLTDMMFINKSDKDSPRPVLVRIKHEKKETKTPKTIVQLSVMGKLGKMKFV